jgi:Metallo-peptidase family M12B Reprolysin-like
MMVRLAVALLSLVLIFGDPFASGERRSTVGTAPFRAVISQAHAQPSDCTDERPCRVRIAVLFTKSAIDRLGRAASGQYLQISAFDNCYRRLRHWSYCVYRILAENNVGAIDRAFKRSGITNVVFDGEYPASYASYTAHGIDERNYRHLWNKLDRSGSSAVYSAMLRDMAANDYIQRIRREKRINIVVMIASPDLLNVGIANPATGNLLMRVDELESALKAGLYKRGGASWQRHRFTLLHEVGHIFGANHDRGAQPVLGPCTHAWACAYVNQGRDFCTVVGQWNRGRFFGCQARKGGLLGTGWIEEYSHASNNGFCRSENYTTAKCGDARHDNAKLMRTQVGRVSRL